MFKKENLLFLILGGFFVTNALVAEFIGIKLFSLEATLGIQAFQFSFFGVGDLSFNLTAGVLLWPVVFIMTDVINEYYGVKGVRLLSWMTAGLIVYAFLMVFGAMKLVPAGFWIEKDLGAGKTINMHQAFNAVFGQGLWIMFGSVTAFLGGQLIDALVFRKLKIMTGDKGIWIRATVSTFISQFIDSFVVLFIAFYLGNNWSFQTVMAVCLVNYLYKFIIAVVFIPVLYLIHSLIRSYLGEERTQAMLHKAVHHEFD